MPVIAEVRFEAQTLPELERVLAAAKSLHGGAMETHAIWRPHPRKKFPTFRAYCTIYYPDPKPNNE